jgi:ferredoxin
MPLPVEEYDGLVFGFPVFADFAPSVINAWLPTLDGQGKRCALFLTYGARSVGYTHFHTKLLLEQAGFQVLFSAEFLGRHSFNVGGWRLAADRPNDADLALARDYAALFDGRLSQPEPPVLHLQKPSGYRYAVRDLETAGETPAQREMTHPKRIEPDCCMCRACEIGCPTLSFDAEAGLSDPATCIECMHCVYICPEHVVHLGEQMKDFYPKFLAHWHLTEDMADAKQSKIITESWQVAS